MDRALSFEDFYRTHRDDVLRALSFTLHDRELALEVTDEAFARAVERWSEVGAGSNPAGWVYRVALNLAHNRRRRLSLERRRPVPTHVRDAWTDDACADPAIARALAALPVDQRAVVVLRYHLDWSVEAVASALDIPSGTVKSRLHRALGQLATMLEANP
ncbi:MAG: RNA polymerase sigma factor [Acidimicrobiales bacterium]